MDSKTTAKTVLLVAVPVVCAVLTVIARVHRLELPFERDEGEYAYIAQMMLRGEAPYSEAYTMKLPGVPIWYAAFFLVFGETVRAAHIAALFADISSAVAIGLFCWRTRLTEPLARIGPRTVPIVAGAAYLVLTSLLCVDGLMANAEKFVVVGVTWSFVLFVDTARVQKDSSVSPRWRLTRLLSAGAVMGTAFVCKQQALPMLAVLGIAAVVRPHVVVVTLMQRSVDGLVVGVGMLLPWLLTVAVIAVWGDFDTMWFHTVEYARAYVGVAPTPGRFFKTAMTRLSEQPLVVFALVGVAVIAFSGAVKRSTRWLVVCWFIAACAAAAVGLYFRRHYFVFIMPPLAITAAFFGTRRWWTAVLLAIATAATVQMSWAQWFTLTDVKLSRRHYGQGTFVEAVAVAEELRRVTKPSERILIIGNEPEVLFLAKRRAVTPYIYFYPLIEPQPFAAQQQAEVIAACEAQVPQHIVVKKTTAKALSVNRHAMGGWILPFLKNYRVIWPKSAPPTIDAMTLSKVKTDLFLLERIMPADSAVTTGHEARTE